MLLRNLAIIAHVDHGKTTLVDELLKQSGAVRENQQMQERALDSGDIERERGITIMAKATSIDWGEYRFNIVDTPGHADFGGEVERIMSMVDGAILLVDAAEGPLPQTKFVLTKALARGLRPIVVINKVDRHDARADEVLDEIFDLFAALDADEHQLDFPVLYAAARDGWCSADGEEKPEDASLMPMLELIRDHVPAPDVAGKLDQPFTMLATTLEADPYLGRLLTGRIESGVVKPNMTVKSLNRDGEVLEQGVRVSRLMAWRGLKRVPLEEAEAGDIVTIAGLSEASVADTICDPAVETALPSQPIDPPVMAVTFAVNDSPLAGTEGDKVTSRVIRDRLYREAEGNVAIQITDTRDEGAFEVAGRGELQLAVLIETMRREGFELSISRPRVLYRDGDGGRHEPFEEVTIDVDEEFSGAVVRKLTERKGQLVGQQPSGGGKMRLVLHVPTRGLIGYLSEFLTDTRGTGIMNRIFCDYRPYAGAINTRRSGVLISMQEGVAAAYALFNLEDRGPMFIPAGVRVYQGMIIGEHTKGTDLEVNLQKAKQLTNFRASGKDDAVRLTTPVKMTLEDALSWIAEDELVEVTPENIRLRKRFLCPHERKREAKKLLAS